MGTTIERDLRGGFARPFAGFAAAFAVMIAHSEASAGECAPPTPACHLANGTKLLDSDPTRAASELLASYRLDERTDTLTLYATALQNSGRYARALETWQRIIVFRESEVVSAQETMKRYRKKRDEARAAAAKAQEQSEHAATQIMALWPKVARVRVQLAGQQLAVTHDGLEVDVAKEVLVNAGRDELVFTRRDGSTQRVVVEVAAGQIAMVDAPAQAERPLARPPAERAPATLPAAREAPSIVETRTEDGSLEIAPRSRTMSRAGLGLAAGGIVGLGVAGTLGYLASRDFDRAKELGCDDDGRCPVGEASERGEQARDRTTIARISAIGGGALLVTGATLWFLGRRETRRATDITVGVGPQSVSIGWSLP